MLVWHFDKKGAYTVKSGYRFLCDNDTMMNSRPHSNISKECWKRVWNIDLPRKLKIFLWRTLQEILPVHTNLASRTIPVPPLCQRCSKEPETTNHALRLCPIAKEVWRRATFDWDRLGNEQEGTINWIVNMVEMFNPVQLQELGVTLWAIWNERNVEAHGGKRRPAQLVKNFIVEFIKDFNMAKKKQTSLNRRVTAKWKPPAENMIKVNFDGSLNKESKFGGIGIVIRNDAREVMGAKAKRIQNVNDPFLIEALAAVDALEFASDRGFKEIVLEGDALSIINALQRPTEERSFIAHQIEERCAIISGFIQCKLQHCLRNCNEVAHQLAKLGLSVIHECCWIEEYPDCIKNAVDAELLHPV
ncbi:hypothetical protein PTKIN_Ptkin18bG0122500 [Pterospermum kingtungense]